MKKSSQKLKHTKKKIKKNNTVARTSYEYCLQLADFLNEIISGKIFWIVSIMFASKDKIFI